MRIINTIINRVILTSNPLYTKPLKLLVCLFLILSFNVRSLAQEYDILVIQSYHQGLEWTDSISSGILSVFKDHPEFNVYFEYMDTKRNTSEGYFHSLIDLYRSRTSKIKYDAIIVADNAAYNFMLEYRDEFFPDVPVFYCGVNFLNKTELLKHPKFYGFDEIANHAETIEMIKQLFPDRKKVLIVNDYTLTGKAIRSELEEVLPKYSDELQFVIVDTFSIDELKERVSSLTNEYTIYLLVVNMDRLGNYISYSNGIKIIRENTTVPLFGSWDFYFGKGIIGGSITRGFEQGKNAAKLAFDYLIGENPHPHQYQSGITTKCVDYKVLNEFNISLKSIPADTRIINTPKERSAWQILWLKITVIVLLLLLIGSLIYLYIRKSQALKLKQLVEQRTKELKEANTNLEKINQSKNEILSVVAHDLRNPIGNVGGFSQLIIDEDNEHKMLDNESRKNLVHILDLSNYMIRLVNNLLDISVIESGVLKLDCITQDYIDFILDEVVKNRTSAENQQIHIEFTSKLNKAMVCYDKLRIRQALNNLLSNAIKFSKPNDTIVITVESDGKQIITKVKDSGPGIPEDKFDQIFMKYSQLDSDTNIKSKGTGLGLSIVKGIIEAHHGKIYLKSKLGEGTKFIYELPIAQ